MANWNPSLKHLPPNFKEDIPDAYLKGWVEFYKLKFKVTADVLIPRPETELLVDEALSFCKQPTTHHTQYTILDIGTGSGNIAISIAKNSKAKIFATDISEEALKVARENAKKHRVEKRIFFMVSDLLSNIQAGAKIDVIVSNLPYIPTGRIPFLDPSVKDFEPRVALDGGYDGFETYRKLFSQIKEKNLHPKLIVCEIDYTQGEIALNEARKFFPDSLAEVKTDLAKKQRILLISL